MADEFINQVPIGTQRQDENDNIGLLSGAAKKEPYSISVNEKGKVSADFDLTTNAGKIMAGRLSGASDSQILGKHRAIDDSYNYDEALNAGVTPTEILNDFIKRDVEGDPNQLNPAQQTTALKLSDDFEAASTDFFKQRDAIGRVEASATDPSAAGDLALIFNYMKVLDPNSVVRESEFATAQNAGSVPQRIRARYNSVIRGTRLDVEQRKDFLDRSRKLAAKAQEDHNLVIDSFVSRANKFGVPADTVVRTATESGQQRLEQGGNKEVSLADQTMQEFDKMNQPETQATQLNQMLEKMTEEGAPLEERAKVAQQIKAAELEATKPPADTITQQEGPAKNAVGETIGLTDIPAVAGRGIETAKEFGGGVKDAFVKRMDRVDEAEKRANAGEQGTLETGFQMLGQGFGLVADIVGEAIPAGAKSATDITRLFTPNFVEKPAMEQGAILKDNILQSEGAQEAFQAIQSGQESWDNFKEINPRAAADVEAVYNIGELLTYAVGVGAAKNQGVKQSLKVGSQVAREVGAVAETGKDVLKTVGGQVKKPLEKATDLITPIDKGTTKILEKTKPEKLANYEKIANEAVNDFSKATPLEKAGDEASRALKSLQGKAKAVGERKTNLAKSVASIDTGNIVNEAQQELLQLAKDRLGTLVNSKGLRSASGRVSGVTGIADRKLLVDVFKKLDKIKKNPTFIRVDDTIDAIQDLVFKRTGNLALPLNSKVEGVIKNVQKSLNDKLKKIGGKDFSKANAEYGEIVDIRNNLSKLLGKDISKGGSLMKRVFSPTDSGTKKLFAKIKKLTDIDLVDEATLAKFVMENAGDARQSNLLEQAILGAGSGIPGKTGFIAGAAGKVIEKLQSPLGKAKRITEKKGLLEKK